MFLKCEKAAMFSNNKKDELLINNGDDFINNGDIFLS